VKQQKSNIQNVVYGADNFSTFITKDKAYELIHRDEVNTIILDDSGFQMGYANHRFKDSLEVSVSETPATPVESAVKNRLLPFFEHTGVLSPEEYLACTTAMVKALFKDLVDKGGEPYYYHLRAVAGECKAYGIETQIVALLHDLLEDIKDVSVADLLEVYPPHIVNSVVILTKKKGQKYSEYIDEVSKDSMALRVKIADLKHNMDITRLPSLGNESVNRLRKYHDAFKFLVGEL
jgi:hypothetical protein